MNTPCCENPHPLTEYSGTTERKFCGNCGTETQSPVDQALVLSFHEQALVLMDETQGREDMKKEMVGKLEGMKQVKIWNGTKVIPELRGYNRALSDAIEIIRKG